VSPQSTREKMRRAVKRCLGNMSRTLRDMKTLDEIAEQQSKPVDQSIPAIITGINMIETLLHKLLKSL